MVAAIAERSSRRVPARSSASRITGTMARRCSRLASSGTTPPYLSCMLICDATTEESTVSPFSTTAAAVSSQEDSMPRMRTVPTLARFVDQALQAGGAGAGAAAGGEVQQAGCLPGAALGGALQVEEHGAGGMVGGDGANRGRDAAEDDGQLVVEVMSGGGGDGADPVGSRQTFHEMRI